jgi:hypothetical protein
MELEEAAKTVLSALHRFIIRIFTNQSAALTLLEVLASS